MSARTRSFKNGSRFRGAGWFVAEGPKSNVLRARSIPASARLGCEASVSRGGEGDRAWLSIARGDLGKGNRTSSKGSPDSWTSGFSSLLSGLAGRDLDICKTSPVLVTEVLDDPFLVSGGRLLPFPSALWASRDRDRFVSLRWVVDLSRFFVVAPLAGVGNGGKAQSRFVNSGEGGRRGPGTDPLRNEGQGDLKLPEPALTGEATEFCPLLAGVSSPWYGGPRTEKM